MLAVLVWYVPKKARTYCVSGFLLSDLFYDGYNENL